jgi:hypothetical protein
MPQEIGPFPAALEIDYPDRELDRVTTFFRLFTFIPIGIILALLSGPTSPGGPAHQVASERARDVPDARLGRRGLPAYRPDAALPQQVSPLVV